MRINPLELLASSFFVFGLALVCGAAAGYFFGLTSVEEVIEKRDAMRSECMKGNDRACRLYEVDYARH